MPRLSYDYSAVPTMGCSGDLSLPIVLLPKRNSWLVPELLLARTACSLLLLLEAAAFLPFLTFLKGQCSFQAKRWGQPSVLVSLCNCLWMSACTSCLFLLLGWLTPLKYLRVVALCERVALPLHPPHGFPINFRQTPSLQCTHVPSSIILTEVADFYLQNHFY